MAEIIPRQSHKPTCNRPGSAPSPSDEANAALLLSQEMQLTKVLRAEVKSLKQQLDELKNWQGDPDGFMSDVAAAIQIARSADNSQVDELQTLRGEMHTLRHAYVTEAGISAAAGNESEREKKALTQESKRFEVQLKGTQQELEKVKKELFSERVRAKRAERDLDGAQQQLRSSRTEMAKLYDDLARARHEVARLTAAHANSMQLHSHKQQHYQAAASAPPPPPPPSVPPGSAAAYAASTAHAAAEAAAGRRLEGTAYAPSGALRRAKDDSATVVVVSESSNGGSGSNAQHAACDTLRPATAAPAVPATHGGNGGSALQTARALLSERYEGSLIPLLNKSADAAAAVAAKEAAASLLCPPMMAAAELRQQQLQQLEARVQAPPQRRTQPTAARPLQSRPAGIGRRAVL